MAAERTTAALYLYGVIDLAQILMVPFVFTGHYKEVMPVMFLVLMAYLVWAVGLASPLRKTALLRGIAWRLCVQILGGLLIGAALALIGFDLGKRMAEAQKLSAPMTAD